VRCVFNLTKINSAFVHELKKSFDYYYICQVSGVNMADIVFLLLCACLMCLH